MFVQYFAFAAFFRPCLKSVCNAAAKFDWTKDQKILITIIIF